jgi:hypothetical protein
MTEKSFFVMVYKLTNAGSKQKNKNKKLGG